LTLLTVAKKEGNAKATGKPYSFLVANVVDEEAKVFGFNLSDELSASPRVQEILNNEEKNTQVFADVRFSPKGFDVSGQIIALDYL